MALQLVEQPDNGAAWSKNPSQLSFIRKGIITTAGHCAQLILVIADAHRPAIGQTLVLSWATNVLTFTVAGPDSTDALYLTPWSGTLFNAATKTVQDLSANPQLSSLFNIDLISNTGGKAYIRIRAINKGVYYNLSTTGSTLTIDSATVNVAGIDEVSIASDYRLKMAVNMMVNKLADPESIPTIELQAYGIPDMENDLIKLDFHELKEIGAGLLDIKLPFCAFKPYMQPRSIAYADIALTEYYNGQERKTLVEQYGNITGYLGLRVLYGGLALDSFPAIVNTAYTNYYTVTFLTHQPRKKLVDTAQPEWLTIMIPDTVGSADDYNVLYHIIYADGSTADHQISITDQLPIQSIYTIPAGWDHSGLASVAPTKVPVYYEVSVVTSAHGDTLSETFTYIIDTRFFRERRYFLVKNSLGGFDTFRTVGSSLSNAKYTRQTSLKALTSDSRSAQGTIEMTTNEEALMWTMRSGWLLNKAEVEYYRQLLLSEYVAEIITPLIPNSGSKIFNQVFRSVIVQMDSINFYEQLDMHYSVEWKMQYANSEINYSTPAIVTPEPYFDSLIELHLVSLTSYVVVDCSSANIRCKVNGKVIGLVSINRLNVTAGIDCHIIIEAESLQTLSITANGLQNLVVKKLASATLRQFSVSGFSSFGADYLVSRIPTLYNITDIIIDTADSTLPVDDLIIATYKLLMSGTRLLSSLSLPSSTPSAIGAASKAQLVASGITVNTL